MIQKVISVGNSLAVVLPKPFTRNAGVHAGDPIRVDTNDALKAVYIQPHLPHRADRPVLTPEFKAWLDEISQKEKDIIQALAKA